MRGGPGGARAWRCPPLEGLPHSCLLLLPRCCPPSLVPLGIHWRGAGASSGRSTQGPADVGVGGAMETVCHPSQGITVNLQLRGARWLVI